jgi:hypothetical protein
LTYEIKQLWRIEQLTAASVILEAASVLLERLDKNWGILNLKKKKNKC